MSTFLQQAEAALLRAEISAMRDTCEASFAAFLHAQDAIGVAKLAYVDSSDPFNDGTWRAIGTAEDRAEAAQTAYNAQKLTLRGLCLQLEAVAPQSAPQRTGVPVTKRGLYAWADSIG